MAPVVEEAPAPSADDVGNAFVHQYYNILHQSPELVHHFYQDISKLGRPEDNGVMSTITTMQAINEKILALSKGGFTAEMATVDAQDSYNGGVIVLVTGYLTGKDNVRRKFSQSFFLAPQTVGYYVLNDVFRYVEDTVHSPVLHESPAVVNTPTSIAIPAQYQDSSKVQENHVPEQANGFKVEVNEGVVYNPSENVDGPVEEEETPAPEVMIHEVPVDSESISEPNPKIEEVTKKSYASIVMKENPAFLSSPLSALHRSVTKNQDTEATVVVHPAPVSETKGPNTDVVEDGNSQEAESNGYSIYIKGLPMDATHAVLENEFQRFGPIQSGGIQVRSQKGFSFGFVEFEVATAVKSAIEASPIMINGCQAVVEEKKSTNRGRGRFFPGRGSGFRNEGPRGRGNFGGGRGYSRGDFNNRNEYGNRGGTRGGFSNRGGNGGYQKSDNMGNGGVRHNGPGMSTNAAVRRVPVPV